MDNQKVTILIPVYNDEQDIITSVKSILSQSYQHFELIVIDDCSTDGTYELVKGFFDVLKDKKVKLIRNDTNMGCYRSLNEGLLIASGTFITILGSDDQFHKQKLENQVLELNKYSNLVAVTCLIQRDNKIIVSESSVLFKKDIINDIGYYDSVRFGADTEFKERIINKYGKNRVGHVNKVLYLAKSRVNSLTNDKNTGWNSKKGSYIRTQYLNNFREWHTLDDKLFMNYPLKIRPFEIDKLML